MAKPEHRVFSFKNESNQARNINVAGFLVVAVAVENAFFLISACQTSRKADLVAFLSRCFSGPRA